MKILICTLLVTLTIFINCVESSPMPLRPPPNPPIRPFLVVPLPPLPERPIRRNYHNPRGSPTLNYREGQLYGVWFNGVFHQVADVVIPARRPSGIPLHGPYHNLPDDAIVFTHHREPVGRVEGGEIYQIDSPGIISPRPAYYVQYEGTLMAVCTYDGFITFRLI